MRSFLEATGRFEVRLAHTTAEGLRVAQDFRPDMILLDVILPDGDGGHLAQQIKDHLHLGAPIVFLTAVVSREETHTQQGTIGGRQFLAKPVSGREVVACIERHLSAEATAR